MGRSPVSHICIQMDNAPEFTSADTHKLLDGLHFQYRNTADYVHQDNYLVENTIRKLDRTCRINYATAPWVPYTTWPGGCVYSLELIRLLHMKARNVQLQRTTWTSSAAN